MKHPLLAIGLAGTLALATLASWAAGDPAEDCRQMAAEEAVPVEDLDDYIAECIAMMENEYPEEAGMPIPDAEGAEAGEAPAQE
jgi:hypothetical protein